MPKNACAQAPALGAETLVTLTQWREIAGWLKEAKAREMMLRKKLAEMFFPEPVEGVNRVTTEDGYEFVLDHKINRKLDVAALDAVMSEIPESSPYREMGVLIEYKPSLVMKGFRAIQEDAKLAAIFAQALTETPGSPELIVNDASPATDPATAPALADWPAKESTPALPVAEAYEAEKKRYTKTSTGKAQKKSATKARK